MYSTTAIASADGTIQQRFRYTAFGTPTFMGADFSPATNANEWQALLHGEYYDLDTVWSNYGYRYYVAILGRWGNVDPEKILDGNNLFSFVRNQIPNARDFLGLRQNWGAATQEVVISPGSLANVTKFIDCVWELPPKTYPIAGNTIVECHPDFINCVGHATGGDMYIQPAPEISWEKVTKSLGFECKKMDKTKKCVCGCGEDRMLFFVYAYENYPQYKDPWSDAWIYSDDKSKKNDVHAIKGPPGCSSGPWTQIPHSCGKPATPKTVGDPENYFSKNPYAQAHKYCCCKKNEKSNPK
jgi:RHS repeat-associated protein